MRLFKAPGHIYKNIKIQNWLNLQVIRDTMSLKRLNPQQEISTTVSGNDRSVPRKLRRSVEFFSFSNPILSGKLVPTRVRGEIAGVPWKEEGELLSGLPSNTCARVQRKASTWPSGGGLSGHAGPHQQVWGTVCGLQRAACSAAAPITLPLTQPLFCKALLRGILKRPTLSPWTAQQWIVHT